MASPIAGVLIMDNQSWRPVSPSHLEKKKFLEFSGLASKTMTMNGSNKLTIPAGRVDREAAVKICYWIASNDINKPTHLTPESVGIVSLKEAVQLYKAAKFFRIPYKLRSDGIRDEIKKLVRAAPLSLVEFKLIHEVLEFDGPLTQVTRQQVMFRKVKGGKHVSPQQCEIEAYSKDKGLWNDMLKIEQDIQGKYKQHNTQHNAQQGNNEHHAQQQGGKKWKGKGGKKQGSNAEKPKAEAKKIEEQYAETMQDDKQYDEAFPPLA